MVRVRIVERGFFYASWSSVFPLRLVLVFYGDEWISLPILFFIVVVV